MSKYSVGNKFIIEIGEVFTGDASEQNGAKELFRIKGFRSLVFDNTGLGNLERFNDTGYSQGVLAGLDSLNCEVDKAYNKGLNDAWELTKKILYGIDRQLVEIFDVKVEPVFFNLAHKRAIINDHTPQEALAKLEAYEKEQDEIKVGDVVYVDGTRSCGIVIAIDEIEKKARLMYEDTSFRTNEWYLADLRKTGKHIDISAILAEIGKE